MGFLEEATNVATNRKIVKLSTWIRGFALGPGSWPLGFILQSPVYESYAQSIYFFIFVLGGARIIAFH